MRANRPLPCVGVPLNIMCSRKCASPVAPGISLREPTLYQVWTVAIGLRWSSRTRMRSPLSSTVSVTAGASAAWARYMASDAVRYIRASVQALSACRKRINRLCYGPPVPGNLDAGHANPHAEVSGDHHLSRAGGGSRGVRRLPDARGAGRAALGLGGGRLRPRRLRPPRQPARARLRPDVGPLHRGLLHRQPDRGLLGGRRAPLGVTLARRRPHRLGRPRDPRGPALAASRRAVENTCRSIGRVSLPVKVFCWLGWKLPRSAVPSGMAERAPWPKRGSGRGSGSPAGRPPAGGGGPPNLPPAGTTPAARRRAAQRRGDVGAAEREPVAGVGRRRLIGEPRLVERAKEPVPAPVSREHAPGAVAAVGGRC